MEKLIKIKEMEFTIEAEGESMEEIFKVPKKTIWALRREAQALPSYSTLVDSLARNKQFGMLAVLLVSVWNSIPLAKKEKE